MPELPDISAYIAALEPRILGQSLERVRLASVFLLRSVDPPLSALEDKTVVALRRIGKRIAIGVEGDLWVILHLMIAGRLHWKPPHAKLAGRNALLQRVLNSAVSGGVRLGFLEHQRSVSASPETLPRTMLPATCRRSTVL